MGIILGGKTFSVEVAQTNFSRERGLSGREALTEEEGMLFIFDMKDKYGFWMKDMKFSIDILWIDENLKIIQMEKSVSPETYPKVFYPETPNLYVLEILGGQADLLGLHLGDSLEFIKN